MLCHTGRASGEASGFGQETETAARKKTGPSPFIGISARQGRAKETVEDWFALILSAGFRP